jgi:small GTP-binding protein
MTSVKIVVVGDGSVGKTCMLMSYAYNNFPSEYIPTVFDNYDTDVMVDGCKYSIHLFDTAGQSDYDHLRPLGYVKTDVFLVCFSLRDPVSCENVIAKWLPELEMHAPGIPRVLVGTKLDLKEELKGRGCVTTCVGESTAHKIGAIKYHECSSLTQHGLKEVFDSAIQAAVTPAAKYYRRGGQVRKCVIL